MYFPCTSITIITLILTTLLLLTAPNSATVAPLQFCKEDVALNLDFCLAISTYSNTSTSAVDLYIAITTSHLNASPLGWIALGLGPSMAGALMFIVFGDPSNEATALIRTAPGHKQPRARPLDLSKRPCPPGNKSRENRIRGARAFQLYKGAGGENPNRGDSMPQL